MADKLNTILEERGSRYGPFEGHASASQELKKVWDRFKHRNHRFHNLPDVTGKVVDEGVMMIMHKFARAVNGDPLYSDNFRDIAGYATLVADHLEELEKKDD